MMMNRKLATIAIALLAAAGAAGVSADKVRTVTGHAVYYAPHSMMPFQARQEAINRAQLDAIGREFGSAVSMSNLSFMQSSTDSERDDFYSIAESDVRGEWIETIGDTIWQITPMNNETLYEVTLKGRIREIPMNRIDIDTRLLYNGTDKDRNLVRNFSYKVGDYMYIYFTSPVDGHLAIYIGDDNDAMTLQSLVPMDGMSEGAYPVKAGQEYVFFDRASAEPQYRDVTRRIKMNARKEMDVNQVYVIFSPNRFAKANDRRSSTGRSVNVGGEEVDLMPREADFTSFQRWLGKARRHDPDMQVIKTVVTVSD